MRISPNKSTEYIKQKNLGHAEKKVAFKGGVQSIVSGISSSMDSRRFLTSISQDFNTGSILGTIRGRVGKSADTLFEHIMGDDLIKQGLIMEEGKLKFKVKKPLRMLIDGVLYPIAKIPFYIFYNGLSHLKKFKAVKNSNWLRNFEQSSFYKASHSYMKKDDKLNSLRGVFEIAAMKDAMNESMWNKLVLQNTSKTFDPKLGNYNGVHERALTRIVTGFIPAVFLANDAHNLSILCNNNKKEAQTEKKLRFSQETKRVVSNAYIQLITLGALSKFINRSKGWFVGVTVGTILITEVYSRLATGKKIHFISEKEAKEINAKENKKSFGKKPPVETKTQKTNPANPFGISINSLEDFIKNPKAANLQQFNLKNTTSIKTDNKKKEKPRSLISAKSLLKFFGGIIAAGFAIRFLKKIPAVGNLFDNIAKQYNKIYKNITMKPNHLQKTEFSKIIEKMKKCGFVEIAQSYEKAVMDFQKLLILPKYTKNIPETLKTMAKSGSPESKVFEELATQLSSIISGKNSAQTLDTLRSKTIQSNFNKFIEYLRNNNQLDLIKQIEQINKDGKIDYDKLRKVFGKNENEIYRDIFENVFAVDDNYLKHNLFQKVKQTLEANSKGDIWAAAEQKAMQEINSRNYFDLGITKKPVIKNVVDFCIEPFRFVWKYTTLAYKGLFDIAGAFKPAKPPKATCDIETVSQALSGLSKKISMNDAQFTDMFNEKIVKGFNSTTMSKIANSDLSALAKTASLFTTMYFLIADNYNMVMLKSNGENKQEADQKGQERFVQEMTRFFWQQLFINLFNNTFSKTYNSSLLGASAVNTASTTIGEICTRKAVGLPVNAASKEEIIELERKNLSGNGVKSKFFRFMSKLTGKQILSERETKKK